MTTTGWINILVNVFIFRWCTEAWALDILKVFKGAANSLQVESKIIHQHLHKCSILAKISPDPSFRSSSPSGTWGWKTLNFSVFLYGDPPRRFLEDNFFVIHLYVIWSLWKAENVYSGVKNGPLRSSSNGHKKVFCKKSIGIQKFRICFNLMTIDHDTTISI